MEFRPKLIHFETDGQVVNSESTESNWTPIKNDMSIGPGLTYAERLGNCVLLYVSACIFCIIVFMSFFLHTVPSNKNDF